MTTDIEPVAQLPEAAMRMALAFFPVGFARRQQLMPAGRLVHYTGAAAAINILRTREVWMRKPQWMNDYTEIDHGFDCISHTINAGEGGKKFKAALEAVSPGIVERAIKNFDSWLPTYRRNTFVTCVADHAPEDDATGRMGMWTAFASGGGVALVLRSGPFTALSDVLGAYSFPVSYRNKEQVDDHFGNIAANVASMTDFLKTVPAANLETMIHELFKFEMLCTKRHAFKEDREWRIVHSPDRLPKDGPRLITKHVEFINGAPQPVCKIPLGAHPGYDISIPTILDRIIVGPSRFADAVIESFVIELERAGVAEASKKVFYADVPLRT